MLPGDQGTLVSQTDGTFVNHPTNPDGYGTMVQHEDGTMVQHGDGTMLRHEEEEQQGTMVQHDTGPGTAISRLARRGGGEGYICVAGSGSDFSYRWTRILNCYLSYFTTASGKFLSFFVILKELWF